MLAPLGLLFWALGAQAGFLISNGFPAIPADLMIVPKMCFRSHWRERSVSVGWLADRLAAGLSGGSVLPGICYRPKARTVGDNLPTCPTTSSG
jgi:hypothetical protein